MIPRKGMAVRFPIKKKYARGVFIRSKNKNKESGVIIDINKNMIIIQGTSISGIFNRAADELELDKTLYAYAQEVARL